MKLGRFLLVLLVLTFLGTMLGGVSGALLGAAVPMQVTLESEASGSEARNGPDASGSVMIAGKADRSPWVAGLALGAGFGLIAGVGAGLTLGVLDQVLMVVREKKGRVEAS